MEELSAKVDQMDKKLNNITMLLNKLISKNSNKTVSTQTPNSYSEALKQPVQNLNGQENSPQPGPSRQIVSTSSRPSQNSPTQKDSWQSKSKSEPPKSINDTKNSTNLPSPVQLKTYRSNLQNILNRRKHLFYSHIRNKELAEIHRHYLDRDVPFIPRKFRETLTPHDSINNVRRKKQLEFLKVENHIANLEENSTNSLANLKVEDEKALGYIHEQSACIQDKLKSE